MAAEPENRRGPAWKLLLEPFGWLWYEHDEGSIAADELRTMFRLLLSGMTDERLRATLDATRRPLVTNCWYAIYQATAVVRAEAEAQAVGRVHHSPSPVTEGD